MVYNRHNADGERDTEINIPSLLYLLLTHFYEGTYARASQGVTGTVLFAKW